jgi:para-nitrobenzyl esterase
MLYFPPVSFPTGTYHASELEYVFDITQTPVPMPVRTPAQQDLADAMVGYWTRFAHSGDPNSAGAPAWPAYTAMSDQFQSLQQSMPTAKTGFAVDHKCAFWGLN